jgi:hypothetical protein
VCKSGSLGSDPMIPKSCSICGGKRVVVFDRRKRLFELSLQKRTFNIETNPIRDQTSEKEKAETR